MAWLKLKICHEGGGVRLFVKWFFNEGFPYADHSPNSGGLGYYQVKLIKNATFAFINIHTYMYIDI